MCKFYAGKEFVAINEDCADCPQGKYQNESTARPLRVRFAKGKQFVTPASACTFCPPTLPARRRRPSAACKRCAAGGIRQ